MHELNFFNYYFKLNPKHENNLTRSFLLALKHIPLVQEMFFELFLSESIDYRVLFGHNQNHQDILDAVYTQKTNRNEIFNEQVSGRTLISLLISDDKLIHEDSVNNENRRAVYDGVLLCKPNLIITVENKPYIKDVWVKQLNPNVDEKLGIQICPRVCSLTWSEIIAIFNELIISSKTTRLEKSILNDFIDYIDCFRPELNPYQKLSVCKGSLSLITKRCKVILSEIKINGGRKAVDYHKDWGYNILSNKATIKQIKLDGFENDGKKFIELTMIAADTQSSSNITYKKLNISKLENLMKKSGYTGITNFHFGFIKRNIRNWFKGRLGLLEYVKFWKNNQNLLYQIKRDGTMHGLSFNDFFKYMIDVGVVNPNEYVDFENTVLSKGYNKLSIRPGFGIFYRWPLVDAMLLDERGEFVNEVQNKIAEIFDIFDEKIE